MREEKSTQSIAIIGAGPAGLMAAQTLLESGYQAEIFDAMPSAGRKFLRAGKGGLNLTFAEDFELFKSRYFESKEYLAPALNALSPDAIRLWAKRLGFETFVGSSGKVYPDDKKAAPLLRAWLHTLKTGGIKFHMRHRLLNYTDASWQFQTPQGERLYHFDAVILALGGASWQSLGSTGAWVEILQSMHLQVTPLKAANMGFNVAWSEVFKEKFSGVPLKNVLLSFYDIQGELHSKLGELLVSEHGVEGSLIYTHSKLLREQLEQNAPFVVSLDLFPHRDATKLLKQLSNKKAKQSLSAFWKRLGIKSLHASLLREVLDKESLHDAALVAKTLKHFPLELNSARPLEEAISTAGGLAFKNLDAGLMLKEYPSVFCAGEMLDWEAPTGGYLLTGVMAQGKQAANALIKFLEK